MNKFFQGGEWCGRVGDELGCLEANTYSKLLQNNVKSKVWKIESKWEGRTRELIRGQRFGGFESRVEGVLFEEGNNLFGV